ncbi:MAG: YggT family protein [Chloroflexi bacterium]|nr:YggT family protein [Chloroflexota bacterium]
MIIIYYLLLFFEILIFARSLLSWFPNIDRSNPTIDAAVRFIYNVTEPVLKPIRDLLPQNSGVDFSPMVVLIIIIVLMQVFRF